MMAQWDCEDLGIEDDEDADSSGSSDCPTQEDDDLLQDSEIDDKKDSFEPNKISERSNGPEVVVFNEPQRTTVHTSSGKRQFLVRASDR